MDQALIESLRRVSPRAHSFLSACFDLGFSENQIVRSIVKSASIDTSLLPVWEDVFVKTAAGKLFSKTPLPGTPAPALTPSGRFQQTAAQPSNVKIDHVSDGDLTGLAPEQHDLGTQVLSAFRSGKAIPKDYQSLPKDWIDRHQRTSTQTFNNLGRTVKTHAAGDSAAWASSELAQKAVPPLYNWIAAPYVGTAVRGVNFLDDQRRSMMQATALVLDGKDPFESFKPETQEAFENVFDRYRLAEVQKVKLPDGRTVRQPIDPSTYTPLGGVTAQTQTLSNFAHPTATWDPKQVTSDDLADLDPAQRDLGSQFLDAFRTGRPIPKDYQSLPKDWVDRHQRTSAQTYDNTGRSIKVHASGDAASWAALPMPQSVVPSVYNWTVAPVARTGTRLVHNYDEWNRSIAAAKANVAKGNYPWTPFSPEHQHNFDEQYDKHRWVEVKKIQLPDGRVIRQPIDPSTYTPRGGVTAQTETLSNDAVSTAADGLGTFLAVSGPLKAPLSALTGIAAGSGSETAIDYLPDKSTDPKAYLTPEGKRFLKSTVPLAAAAVGGSFGSRVSGEGSKLMVNAGKAVSSLGDEAASAGKAVSSLGDEVAAATRGVSEAEEALNAARQGVGYFGSTGVGKALKSLEAAQSRLAAAQSASEAAAQAGKTWVGRLKALPGQVKGMVKDYWSAPEYGSGLSPFLRRLSPFARVGMDPTRAISFGLERLPYGKYLRPTFDAAMWYPRLITGAHVTDNLVRGRLGHAAGSLPYLSAAFAGTDPLSALWSAIARPVNMLGPLTKGPNKDGKIETPQQQISNRVKAFTWGPYQDLYDNTLKELDRVGGSAMINQKFLHDPYFVLGDYASSKLLGIPQQYLDIAIDRSKNIDMVGRVGPTDEKRQQAMNTPRYPKYPDVDPRNQYFFSDAAVPKFLGGYGGFANVPVSEIKRRHDLALVARGIKTNDQYHAGVGDQEAGQKQESPQVALPAQDGTQPVPTTPPLSSVQPPAVPLTEALSPSGPITGTATPSTDPNSVAAALDTFKQNQTAAVDFLNRPETTQASIDKMRQDPAIQKELTGIPPQRHMEFLQQVWEKLPNEARWLVAGGFGLSILGILSSLFGADED